MKVEFDTPADRERHHRHIREAAREIEDDTPLLRTLFTLENGCEKTSKSGFGWVAKNNPTTSIVRFQNLSKSELEGIAKELSTTTASDLGVSGDPQLQTIADNLTETGERLISVIDD